MPRLQRGILPVICKAEKLARFLREIVFPMQVSNGRKRKNRSRRAAAFRAKRSQLGEIGILTRSVGHATIQAKSKRSRQQVARSTARILFTVGSNGDSHRKIRPS